MWNSLTTSKNNLSYFSIANRKIGEEAGCMFIYSFPVNFLVTRKCYVGHLVGKLETIRFSWLLDGPVMIGLNVKQ